MSDFEVLSGLPDQYDWAAHDSAAPCRRLDAARPPASLTDHGEGARAYRPDPDLRLAVNAAIQLRVPLLVTSNNERRLPDAFLRRCIVHHIAMTPDLMRRAVAAHGGAFPELAPPVRAAAIARFQALRREDRLSRKPGIAELLAWLVTLARAHPGLSAADLEAAPLADLPHLHCLVKDQDDREVLREPGRR